MAKMTKNNLKVSIVFILTSLVVFQLFQNCAKLEGFTTEVEGIYLAMGSEGEGDLVHPAPKETSSPTQKLQFAHREYVATLMREIFTDASYPVTELEPLIFHWIYSRGAQFGSACNAYSTHSGRDCGGDIANANLTIRADSNTVRESFRVQFCENILAIDNAVRALTQKIENRPTAPDQNSIIQIYDLFYRGDPPSDEVVQALLELDRSLASNNETELNRWRAVALQICESSGWQLQ